MGSAAAALSFPVLSLQGVGFAYGGGEPVLADLSLAIEAGEFVSLLGPSGCGKSTVLRLLAGLEVATSGQVDFRAGQGQGLQRAVVFQDYSLFPWMSLQDNVALAIAKARPGFPRSERRALATEYLELVGLGSQGPKHPEDLSGGMRQRGAIARALATEAPVLLMDEPFGALDPLNRIKLQDLLLDVWSGAASKRTVVFVTHDVDEAIFLSDRVTVLGASPGRIIGNFTVKLPRPRHRRDAAHQPAFAELRSQVTQCMEQDVLGRLESSEVMGIAEGV
jgi:NitT/TauT family transport system ATP-binding protein